MWLWILIGFDFISKLYGYASGRFPEACDSMLPVHRAGGGICPPQTSEPPFTVSYELGQSSGDPVKVTLKSNDSGKFLGFMLQARDMSLGGRGPPVGKFISLDPSSTVLLQCGGSENSSVSHRDNQPKSSFSVSWTAQGEERDVIFRATFSQTFTKHWERVDVKLLRPTSPLVPSTAQVVGISLLCLDCVLEEVKTKISTIITVSFASRSRGFHYKHSKKSMAVFCTLCVANSICALVLFVMSTPYKVSFAALAAAVLGVNFLEWVIALLPLGPSHELNEVLDLFVQVCSVLHHICSNALIFLGVINSMHDWGEIMEKSWRLHVMAAYTGWMFLSLVWDVGLTANKGKIQKMCKKDDSQGSGPQKFHVFVTVVSVMFLVGTAAFSVAVTVGLFVIQKN